jgi:sugar O-acyltransferase (sialic acid O-acetyltransferase NeuD family)
MTPADLILIGAGGHARACIDVIEDRGGWRIVGLIGLPEELGTEYFGYRVLGTDQNLRALRDSCPHALITVGQIETAALRERLYRQAVEMGFDFPAIVARDAYVARSAVIGKGSIVMHGAIVNAGASVGENCIINSRALIEHDAVVEEHCHVSTGALLNGGVHVGAGSFVGSGSTVKQGVHIGRRCLVGMGCVVRRDLAENTRFTGAST